MLGQDKFTKNILPIVDKLFRFAFNITGNKEDAEDVVQDVLFNIWNKEEWDGIKNLEAYCFRSVRNVALDKLALKENQVEEIPDNYEPPLREDDIQKKLEDREQIEQLEKWMANLPEKQRAIFLLREFEELSYKEIADILTISEEQVKVNLFRLRRKLKEYFDKV
jgi:RNA polymerase sigma-70 factor (ECF subfamily)